MRVNPGGIILIAIGLLFLANNFNLFSWGYLWRLWPLILVAVGVTLLFPRRT